MAKVALHCGDCREVLLTLPVGSIQTCVTSPPYFGLRDYGTATWEGGDPGCDHSAAKKKGRADYGFSEACVKQRTNASAGFSDYKNTCSDCGARRVDRQIGLEETPERYVAEMVEVFRAVRRALRDDGTLWLNLGDSYAAHSGGTQGATSQRKGRANVEEQRSAGVPAGLKAKDLIGIPWRVAFALQADGWYLRSDIIWSKPNPMPESVTDRPTKAHEYLFLLAKQERYYYDAKAIKERSTTGRWGYIRSKEQKGTFRKDVGNPAPETQEMSNKRSVWTVTSQPYDEAHFATFPPKLIIPCVRAGSKPGDTILDPFNGAGTTAVVAKMYARKYVGIDVNQKYLDMTMRRLATTQDGFSALLPPR